MRHPNPDKPHITVVEYSWYSKNKAWCFLIGKAAAYNEGINAAANAFCIRKNYRERGCRPF